MREPCNSAVLSTWFQPEDPKSLRDDHTIAGVIRWGDALEDLEALQSSLSSWCLVRNHASDSFIENPRRGTEVERSMGLIESGCLSEISMVLDFFFF